MTGAASIAGDNVANPAIKPTAVVANANTNRSAGMEKLLEAVDTLRDTVFRRKH
ncbi:MAG: hypothetical protein ABI846_01790 [Rudaea sp.]